MSAKVWTNIIFTFLALCDLNLLRIPMRIGICWPKRMTFLVRLILDFMMLHLSRILSYFSTTFSFYLSESLDFSCRFMLLCWCLLLNCVIVGMRNIIRYYNIRTVFSLPEWVLMIGEAFSSTVCMWFLSRINLN